MRAYADSNFLTRLYLLTDALPAPLPLVEGIMLAGSRFPVFWLHRIEVCNALELHVFVSRNGGEMRVTAEMAAAAQGRFTEEWSSQRSPLQNVAIDEGRLEQTFRNLSQRHTARQGFRTYDILHVSAALILGCDAFYSYDAKCNRLAAAEGLSILKV